MTHVVYFSGVHGSGKTTIRTKTTQRLQKAGISVYAFPEFSYVPDIKMGTPEFQLWYRMQLRIRQELIQYLVNTKYFDIILVDRHTVDEKIYAKRLGGQKYVDYELEPKSIHIFINRPINDIVTSLTSRMEQEANKHRKEWNETNLNYINAINDDFVKLYERKKSFNIQTLINTDLNNSIDEALRIIMECIL